MSDHLFSPIQLGTLDLQNRIAVSPMCQYSADDGCASDWHLQHWMNLAMSGAGMVTVEMTDGGRKRQPFQVFSVAPSLAPFGPRDTRTFRALHLRAESRLNTETTGDLASSTGSTAVPGA